MQKETKDLLKYLWPFVTGVVCMFFVAVLIGVLDENKMLDPILDYLGVPK